MTETEKARKTLEQKILPKMYLQEKSNMLNSILDKEGKFFVDLMAILLGVVDNEYKSEGFKVYLHRAKSEDKFFDFVVVKQPECKTAGIADTLYFCLEEITGESEYFMAQNSLGGGRILRSSDGEELKDHGELLDDADKEFQKMANIFIRRVHGIGQ